MTETEKNIDRILVMAAEQRASDIHLRVGEPPILRVNTELIKMEMERLVPDNLNVYAQELLTGEQFKNLSENMDEVDRSYSVKGVGRFRINIFYNRGNLGIVLRRINIEIPTFEELALPQNLKYFSEQERGMVIVCGTTGCGKSTTLAALIDHINETRNLHVVTIEDPIEYLHRDKKSIITQREIATDTKDFKSALKHVVRQDPDVILIGELRDAETIQAGLNASETGHLVFTTLHTTTAAQTIERILDFFPKQYHQMVRNQLALHLKGTIAQRLLQRADGGGMIPAVEIMSLNTVVKKLITEGKINMIKSVIHHCANEGMQTFDQDLVNLYNQGLVTFEEAQQSSDIPDSFHLCLQGFFPDISKSIFE